MQVTYEVKHLPQRLTLGRQTETGVKEFRIDCAEWQKQWPGLRLSIWVTPPRGAAYNAVTYMNGTELVWTITDTDTACTGRGTVEIVGEASNVRKLSEIVEIVIL